MWKTTHAENVDSNVFVDVLKDDFEGGHDDELRETGLAEDGAHRDEDGSRAEIGKQESRSKERKRERDVGNGGERKRR